MGIHAEPEHATQARQPEPGADTAAGSRATHQGPSPQALDKLLAVNHAEANANASTPSVATAPIDMGDCDIGVRTSHETTFFNMEKSHLIARWQLAGDPAFRLDRAPQHLRPNHEGFDPSKSIKVSVEPRKEGEIQGELEMEATWPAIEALVSSPPRPKTEVFRIPVRARASSPNREPVRQEPKPGSKPDPEACLSRVPLHERLAPFPSEVALEDAMNNSSLAQELFKPVVRKTCGTQVIMTMTATQLQTSDNKQVVRNPVFDVVNPAVHFNAEGTQSPIRIRFRPTVVGRQDGVLDCTIRYADGQLEKRSVGMHGRSITSKEIPADERDRPSTAVPAKPAVDYADVRGLENEKNQLESIRHLAGAQARAIAGAQRRVLYSVSENIQSYRKAPPPSSIWEELAKVAVTMGVATIGGVFASAFAPGVARLLSKMTGGLSEHKDIVAGLTESLQEGFRIGAEGALGAAPRPVDGVSPEAGEAIEVSSNPRIAFVTKQAGILGSLEIKNEIVVHDQHKKLQHLLRHQPQVAYESMQMMHDRFEEIADETAEGHQLRSSATQWVAGVARSSGSEVLKDPVSGRPRQVTKLEAIAPTYKSHDTPGLLRIAVQWDAGSDAGSAALRVTSAAIHGVSQEIADNLRGTSLAGYPIPIRVRVVSDAGSAHVTRDEAGRVQVAGRLPVGDAEVHEANMHRNATLKLPRFGGRFGVCESGSG